jgi:uncharacterized protein YkwD
VAIVGLFCCLFLIAGLKQGEATDSKAMMNVASVDNGANIITATNQIRNTKTQLLNTPSTSSIDIPKKTVVDDAEHEKKSVQQDVTTKKPSTIKNETSVSSVETISDGESDVVYTKEVTRLIEEKTNAFRVSEDLLPLSYDIRLERNATAYSHIMQDGDFLSHTNTSGCGLTCRFTKDGYEATAWGENLATMSFGSRPSAEEVASFFMAQWKKSAGHRENLMSPVFTNQGIGVAVSANSVYATVQFAKP